MNSGASLIVSSCCTLNKSCNRCIGGASIFWCAACRKSKDGDISLPKAIKKLIDSSACNLLILNGGHLLLCGLQAIPEGRDRREEWLGERGMCRKTAKMSDRRSPQASAIARTNTRHSSLTYKKKPQLITVGALILVETAGIEPASANPLQTVLHT